MPKQQIHRNYRGQPAGQRSISAAYIGDPVDTLRDIFQVTVIGYYGDADMYETLKFGFKDSDKMVSFLNFLSTQLSVAYPNGRGGDQRYSAVVPDWNLWFGDEPFDGNPANQAESNWPMFSDEWGYNWDIGGELSFDSAYATYFDGNGIEHEVNWE